MGKGFKGLMTPKCLHKLLTRVFIKISTSANFVLLDMSNTFTAFFLVYVNKSMIIDKYAF